MRGIPDAAGHEETHAVENQPPPFEDVNLFDGDAALREGLRREGGGFAEDAVRRYGALAGGRELLAQGQQANAHAPELRTHDRFGHRIDEVEFHPAWHAVLRTAMAHEVHNLPWRERRPGAHVARAAIFFLHTQAEAGSCCPLTMTFACVPALQSQPDVFAEWEAPLLGTDYDPRGLPAREKRSVLVGMAMTEKQGGSDVRANTTRARPTGRSGPGETYELVGHKWFCSAPMCDAFLTLARTERGIACFLVPRWLPDGARNPLQLQRLKDKLGNRSNASAEIEYRGTLARMVGEDGRGVRTILGMVQHTRLDCVTGSAGLVRQAVAQALHHAAHRTAFGRRLALQPLMRNVLADLALESEAATALALRLARAFDLAPEDPAERGFARLATAVAKYQVCKRAPALVAEAMECLGGNGYVEESILPRIYREVPVNAIWEGSGNVICLDVLRAMAREPESLEAVRAELAGARGGDRRLDAWVAALDAELARPEDAEARARRTAERLALALQAGLLVRFAPAPVADAFCASRLGGEGGQGFGTLPPGCDLEAILERSAPA
jgi:putative acyl-CoA dehydrogenase